MTDRLDPRLSLTDAERARLREIVGADPEALLPAIGAALLGHGETAIGALLAEANVRGETPCP